jgi:hypothetical protein
MKPSEIRTELLAQHERIRARVLEARGKLDEWQAEPPARGELREELNGRLAALIGVVLEHNAREEELLRDVLPTVDAWGPARAEIMLEEHTREHDALYKALLDAFGVAGGAAAHGARDEISALLDRMLEHMAREEKICLTEEVLRDDGIVRDYFGG